MKNKERNWYIPVTPGGSCLVQLQARSEKQAWKNVLREAAHMPYGTVEGFKRRGYSVEKWPEHP